MKLSLALWFKKTVPGHIFRGKYRLVKRVSKRAMEREMLEYERQDNIIQMLQRTYLTAEQSHGHVKHLNKLEKHVEKRKELMAEKAFKPHVTIEERLKHLKVTEGWE